MNLLCTALTKLNKKLETYFLGILGIMCAVLLNVGVIYSLESYDGSGGKLR